MGRCVHCGCVDTQKHSGSLCEGGDVLGSVPSGTTGLSPCHRQQRGGPDTLFAFLTLPVIG